MPPHIEHLHWDDWNRGHIAKHAVLPEEAEEVVVANPMIRETYKRRLQYIGASVAGRMLSVVIGAVPDQPGVFYVFSARPASRKERALYEQMIGSSNS